MHIEHREIGDKGMFGIFLLTPCVPSNTYQLTLNGTTLHTLGIEGMLSCSLALLVCTMHHLFSSCHQLLVVGLTLLRTSLQPSFVTPSNMFNTHYWRQRVAGKITLPISSSYQLIFGAHVECNLFVQ